MVNMAAADFVTKQQPTGNLIMWITQTILAILADAVSLTLIFVVLLKGTIWLDMVSTWWAIRPWGRQFWSSNGPILTRIILNYGVSKVRLMLVLLECENI
jgi:hypothetical protein